MPSLTAEQAQQLVSLLDALAGQADPIAQPWDPAWANDVFNAGTRAFTLTAVEMVALQRGATGNWKVFLTQRPNKPKEPFPLQWHSPGTFVFPSDTTIPDDQLQRLERREIQPARYVDPVLTGIISGDAPWPRGRLVQLVYLVKIEGDPDQGAFFNINHLPQPFHELHHPLIACALKEADELGW